MKMNRFSEPSFQGFLLEGEKEGNPVCRIMFSEKSVSTLLFLLYIIIFEKVSYILRFCEGVWEHVTQHDTVVKILN